jgi:hypothetical protein
MPGCPSRLPFGGYAGLDWRWSVRCWSSRVRASWLASKPGEVSPGTPSTASRLTAVLSFGSVRRMQPFMALEPGSWADWFNAAATSLAFGVALLLFLIGLRDRRRATEDRERDQARKVWLWARWHDLENEKLSERITWYINNHSDDPVIDCRVGLASTPTREVATRPPDRRLIQAGEETEGWLAHDTVYLGDHPQPRLQLLFTDAAGLQWRRDSEGHLTLWRRPRPAGAPRPARVGCAVRWNGPHR